MDAKRFAELVHSLREAGRVARGERSRALAGDDELTLLCEQVVGFFEGDVAKTALWFRLPNPLLGDRLAAGHDPLRALRQVAGDRG